MMFLGVDPGKTGALVILTEEGRVHAAMRMPVVKTPTKTVFDYLAAYVFLFNWIERDDRSGAFTKVQAAIEKSAPMPSVRVNKAGKRVPMPARAAASFYTGVGFWHGFFTAKGWPWVEVGPRIWRRAAGLASGADKADVVAAARQRWPELPIQFKLDWGMADAAFIADWARRLALATKE